MGALRQLAYVSGHPISSGTRGTAFVRDIDLRSTLLQASAPWFDTWPESFVAKLQEAHFGALGQRPNRQIPRHWQFRNVPELRRVFAAASKARFDSRWNGIRQLNSPEDPLRLSLLQVRKSLGLTRYKVAQLSSAGAFGEVSITKKGGYVIHYVFRSNVESFRSNYLATISQKEAARRLGLSPLTFAALNQSKELGLVATECSTLAARFDPSTIQDFANSIFNTVIKIGVIADMRCLPTALEDIRLRLDPPSTALFLTQVLDGLVPLYTAKSLPSELTDLFIPKRDLRNFYKRVRNGHPVSA